MKRKKKPEPNYKDFQCHSIGDTGLTDRERQLKDELKKYKEEHPKPWYL